MRHSSDGWTARCGGQAGSGGLLSQGASRVELGLPARSVDWCRLAVGERKGAMAAASGAESETMVRAAARRSRRRPALERARSALETGRRCRGAAGSDVGRRMSRRRGGSRPRAAGAGPVDTTSCWLAGRRMAYVIVLLDDDSRAILAGRHGRLGWQNQGAGARRGAVPPRVADKLARADASIVPAGRQRRPSGRALGELGVLRPWQPRARGQAGPGTAGACSPTTLAASTPPWAWVARPSPAPAARGTPGCTSWPRGRSATCAPCARPARSPRTTPSRRRRDLAPRWSTGPGAGGRDDPRRHTEDAGAALRAADDLLGRSRTSRPRGAGSSRRPSGRQAGRTCWWPRPTGAWSDILRGTAHRSIGGAGGYLRCTESTPAPTDGVW